MTAPHKSCAAAERSGQAAEATIPQVHTGCECSRDGGSPFSSDVLAYALSTECVDDDEPTRVWPPVFFGEVVRVAPYPADQQLPDPRVASAMAATVRQTPVRLPR